MRSLFTSSGSPPNSPPQQGLVRHPLDCEPLQVARALTGEWPIAMALENGRVREQRLEHGVHLQVESTTMPTELCGEVVDEEAAALAPRPISPHNRARHITHRMLATTYDAGNLHVRIRGGPGGEPPGLPDQLGGWDPKILSATKVNCIILGQSLRHCP